jgi:hypothetical protein
VMFTSKGMALRRPVHKLTDLEIHEISVADKGTNEGARIVLIKRDQGVPMDPREVLLDCIESIFDDDGLDQAAKQVALIDMVRQYIVWTAENAGVRSGAPKAETFVSSQSPDIAVAGLVKRVADGEETRITKNTIETIARCYADSDCKPGESLNAARARFHQSPNGRLLREAAKRAPLDEVIAVEKAFGPAVTALHKRADKIRTGTSMTREQAVAKIAVSGDPNDAQFWQAAREEERARI